MKFDYCISNPPYQETKGGTKNIDVWPSFIDAATQVADKTCMVHPGRWVVPKKQMQSVNTEMTENGLYHFDYYPNASELFGKVDIRGGITVTLFKNGYNGDISYNIDGKPAGVYKNDALFFSNKFETEVYRKIYDTIAPKVFMSSRMLGNVGSLGGSEFGYKKHGQIEKISDDATNMKNPIKIWANTGYGSGTRFAWHYIERDALINPPDKLFRSRKVMIDKKGHSIDAGKSGNIIGNIPQIVGSNTTASGDVFFFFPENDTDYDLQLLKSMFMTRTIRFLMSIIQKDQYVRGFELIPDYTYFIPMLKGALFTDEFFYKTFDFSKELIKHIESCVSEKKENTKGDN